MWIFDLVQFVTQRVSTSFICLHGFQIIICIVQGRMCGQVWSYIRYNIRIFHSHGAWLERRHQLSSERNLGSIYVQRYSQEVKSLALQLKLTTNRSSLQLLARRVVGVYWKVKPILSFSIFLTIRLLDLITQDSSRNSMKQSSAFRLKAFRSARVRDQAHQIIII